MYIIAVDLVWSGCVIMLYAVLFACQHVRLAYACNRLLTYFTYLLTYLVNVMHWCQIKTTEIHWKLIYYQQTFIDELMGYGYYEI